MEGLLVQPQPQGLNRFSKSAFRTQNANIDATIIQDIQVPSRDRNGKGNSYERIADSFSFTAQKVLEKLNTILAEAGVADISTLQPAEYTPEKTADRLVSQIGSLFGAYQKQNADKSPEELVAGFMKLARQGVEQGYDEAYGILEDIGAFELDGIRSGTEETKRLIDEKLNAFEDYLAKQLGIKTDDVQVEDFEAPVKQSLLAQGGAQIDVTA